MAEFHLNELSLLAFMLLPFAYLMATRHSLISQRRRGKDFGFGLLAIAGAALVVAEFLGRGVALPPTERLLIFLHFAPLMLTFLIISRLRELGDLRKLALGDRVHNQPGKDASDFSPKALNDSVESVGWDDLIIGEKLREELSSVIELLKDGAAAARYGITVPRGILMQGPPGTGKTTLAKVVANTAGLSFYALRMDEIVSKYVGESEKNLSRLFEEASRNTPAVIFIDEVESIGKARGAGSHGFGDGLLNHLLQLMDGVVRSDGLYVIAATNRADLVDGALLRPGRLEKVVDVPLPNTKNRGRIFELYLSKMQIAGEIDRGYLAEASYGCSGAEIKAICNQAALNAYRRKGAAGNAAQDYSVSAEDLYSALQEFSKTAA